MGWQDVIGSVLTAGATGDPFAWKKNQLDQQMKQFMMQQQTEDLQMKKAMFDIESKKIAELQRQQKVEEERKKQPAYPLFQSWKKQQEGGELEEGEPQATVEDMGWLSKLGKGQDDEYAPIPGTTALYTKKTGKVKETGLAGKEESKAPTVRSFTEGDRTVERQWNPQTQKWETLSEGPRYKLETGGGGSGLPKPPKDWRYTPDGELEPIPGGKEDTKQRKQYAGDKGRVDNITKTLTDLKIKTGELKKNPALGKVVGISGVIPDYPGGKAADARKALDQIKNRIMIDTLKAMKELSANGAAGFGQLTEKEGTRLEQYITTLDNAQSLEAVIKALGDVEDYATYLSRNIKTTFDETYSEQAHARYGKGRSGGEQTPRFKIIKVE